MFLSLGLGRKDYQDLRFILTFVGAIIFRIDIINNSINITW